MRLPLLLLPPLAMPMAMRAAVEACQIGRTSLSIHSWALEGGGLRQGGMGDQRRAVGSSSSSIHFPPSFVDN